LITENKVPEEHISRWRWWIHLFLIGGYPLLIIPFAFLRSTHGPALTSTTRGWLMVSAVNIGLFLILLSLAWLASRATRQDLLFNWRPGWWVIPLGFCYSIAIRFMVGIVISLIIALLLVSGLLTRESLSEFFNLSRPNVETLVDVTALRTNPAYFWLTVTFGSFVVAGLREEIWRAATLAGMRALWPDTFDGREGQLAAVALIAMVFGIAHLSMGALAAAMAALIGLFLGIIMVVHGSIWPAVVAHGFFDATTFALLPYLHDLRPLH
jgi:membrane protease YdiL (CAAX protease family)